MLKAIYAEDGDLPGEGKVLVRSRDHLELYAGEGIVLVSSADSSRDGSEAEARPARSKRAHRTRLPVPNSPHPATALNARSGHYHYGGKLFDRTERSRDVVVKRARGREETASAIVLRRRGWGETAPKERLRQRSCVSERARPKPSDALTWLMCPARGRGRRGQLASMLVQRTASLASAIESERLGEPHDLLDVAALDRNRHVRDGLRK